MANDDFWSVDKLLPRIKSPGFENRSSGVKLSDLSVKPGEKTARFGEINLVSDSRVIRSFALYCETSLFSFPPIPTDAAEMPFIPCDLYSPSYLLLTRDQRACFHFFMRCVRENKKVETSFSYLKLAICALLAESKKDLPEEFFSLWETYREDFPAAEKLFCDVWSDWCFYQKIKPDFKRRSDFLSRGHSRVQPLLYQQYLFDFLFQNGRCITKQEAEFALCALTSLNFRKSRAYRSHALYAELTERALWEAVNAGIFNRPETNDSLFSLQIPAEVRTIRSLFSDLPQAHRPQTQICLVYIPLINDEVIRDRYEAVVRYVDNRIRALLKMKNSLGRVTVTPAHKAFLDEILKKYQIYAPTASQGGTPPVQPEIPDPPRELIFDPKKAQEIEEGSWALTEKLAAIYETGGEMVTLGQTPDETFDRSYQRELFKMERRAGERAGENPFLELASVLTEEEDLFVSTAVHAGTEAAQTLARSKGLFFDALIASCNQKAVDTTDDAIFDASGNVFQEYLNDLKEVFLPPKGGSAYV